MATGRGEKKELGLGSGTNYRWWPPISNVSQCPLVLGAPLCPRCPHLPFPPCFLACSTHLPLPLTSPCAPHVHPLAAGPSFSEAGVLTYERMHLTGPPSCWERLSRSLLQLGLPATADLDEGKVRGQSLTGKVSQEKSEVLMLHRKKLKYTCLLHRKKLKYIYLMHAFENL